MAEKTNALLIHGNDSVVTLMESVKKNEAVSWLENESIASVTALEDIQKYHKIAIRDIKKGSQVTKYGENIGTALSDIQKGAWVHTHNLSDIPEEVK